MSRPTTAYTRMTRVALRFSSSSGARVPQAHFAPCVLELLGHARPRAHAAMERLISVPGRQGAAILIAPR
jgi:hypothetical protein